MLQIVKADAIREEDEQQKSQDIFTIQLEQLLKYIDKDIENKVTWKPVPSPVVRKRRLSCFTCFGLCFGKPMSKNDKGVYKIGSELKQDLAEELRSYVVLTQVSILISLSNV
jgi:hypothetical protein